MKKVRTKAYTINRLISEVKALSSRKVKDYDTFISSLSPRSGVKSAKVKVLNTFLGGDLKNIVSGKIVPGNNIKARVVSALKNRKTLGYWPSN